MATINQVTELFDEFTREFYDSNIKHNIPRKSFSTFVDNFIKKKVENKKSSKKKIISQEVLDLKIEYEDILGKKPKGPKANDMDWLKSKIDEVKKETNTNSSSSDDEDIKKSDDEDIKKSDDEYIKKSDDEYIKKSDDEYIKKSDDEDIKKETNINSSSSDEDIKKLPPQKGIKSLELELDTSLEEFEYEGIIYTKKCIICYDESERWFVFNDNDEEVGEWIDKDEKNDAYVKWNQ